MRLYVIARLISYYIYYTIFINEFISFKMKINRIKRRECYSIIKEDSLSLIEKANQTKSTRTAIRKYKQ